MSHTLNNIRNFVYKNILKENNVDVSDTLDLRAAGLLSSLALIRLVSFVEDEFGITVGISDPRIHFTSLHHIAQYIDEKLAKDKK